MGMFAIRTIADIVPDRRQMSDIDMRLSIAPAVEDWKRSGKCAWWIDRRVPRRVGCGGTPAGSVASLCVSKYGAAWIDADQARQERIETGRADRVAGHPAVRSVAKRMPGAMKARPEARSIHWRSRRNLRETWRRRT
ncbi:hypothetical protein AA12717_2462 [Gluconacetobacter sacchari DSM 12717]|uniref:Uncharacterized protein n=1 Tax=Gluconacetobacter sacchari DSM 12717 TaxID=1307940 RepID=A0ABQ0P8M9_9PROT|nr:hypothetical protein AA12717_2462 [Gluconacetobacter sacchari DSM 12717]